MGSNRIHNPAMLGRIVSFEGLPKVGTCSPTDVDFAIEVAKDKLFLCGDFKNAGNELGVGQRIILETTVRAYTSIGYRAAAFLAWHSPEEQTIDAAAAKVIRVFSHGIWYEVSEEKTTVYDRYVRFFNVQIAVRNRCSVCGKTTESRDGRCETCKVAETAWEHSA